LHFASKELSDGIEDDPDILQGGILSEVIIGADVTLHYIPMELHEKMTATFYQGYIFVILTVLRLFLRGGDHDDDNAEDDDPSHQNEEEEEEEGKGVQPQSEYPTVDSVTSHLAEIQAAAAHDPSASDDTKTEAAMISEYLDAGGKAEYALEAIVDNAWEKSPEGTEYTRFPHIREQEEENEKDREWMPKCANDLNFKLVRTKLGLAPERRGPYWFFLTDLEDGDEDDEDEDGNERLYTGVRVDESEPSHGDSDNRSKS